MYTNGDTYSHRRVQARASSRQEQPPGRGAQVDAQVAALFERVAQLESTIRRLDSAVADLESELREARRQSGGQVVRSAPESQEFKTEPSTQTRWFPGAAPKSGSALRAMRSGAAAVYADEDQIR